MMTALSVIAAVLTIVGSAIVAGSVALLFMPEAKEDPPFDDDDRVNSGN